MSQKDAREPQGHQPDFGTGSVAAAGVESTERGVLTSQHSAYFPAENSQNHLIITEPTFSCSSEKLPPVSMILPTETEGAAIAAASLTSDLLFVGRSGAVATLKELARAADAARRER